MAPVTTVVKAPYLWLRRAVTDMFFERRYGVRTAGVVDLDQLGLADEERSEYKAAGWRTLQRILPAREVRRHDVFIDFGSGMGRIVLQAARYPFRRVVGVEISEQLTQIARENLARNMFRLRCADVSLVRADVLDYEIPDDVSIAFFANPFTGSIFARVIEALMESVDRAPRTVQIIYFNPVEEPFLLGTGRIRHVRTVRGMRPTAAWSRSNSTRLYVIEPPTELVARKPG